LQPKLSTKLDEHCVFLQSIVSILPHILIFVPAHVPEIDRNREKHGRVVYYFENSDLHEHCTKLDGPKTTMMLQEMERLLVPLGTPGSKHK